ncbi:hypothetical protein RJ639_038219 [Escallonia herrerae]|uniref:Uncharacterized protein n=1 Tax=Escallonia herrerae TaxID=1293975 RepID=A0AA89BAD6_9ASTE|nr:hypothetical protein RJ639_038219 [Escallonia herrerae]
MNISTSECSSGCESGWTMYLDQSSNSGDRYRRTGGEGGRTKGRNGNVGEEDEDLSMVSDASSGPRHFQEDDQDYCFDHGGYFGGQAKKGKQKKKVKESRGKQQNACLDDTASSPILDTSKANAFRFPHTIPSYHGNLNQISEK